MVVNWGKVWYNLPRVSKSVQSQLPGFQAVEINAFGKVNDKKIGKKGFSAAVGHTAPRAAEFILKIDTCKLGAGMES